MSGQGAGANDADDRALVLRAQDGEAGAFEQLVDRYQGRLFRSAYMILGDRQESEDVVQDSLLRAWRALAALNEPGAFGGWVMQICTRRATDVVRHRARRGTSALESDRLEAAGESAPLAEPGLGARRPADPAHTAEVNAQLHTLAGVLARIEPDLRSCWVLREIDGMAYQEIARTLQLTESTVRGRIARGRAQIIRQMEEWR